jgi:hypothetical protein
VERCLHEIRTNQEYIRRLALAIATGRERI